MPSSARRLAGLAARTADYEYDLRSRTLLFDIAFIFRDHLDRDATFGNLRRPLLILLNSANHA
jgi:hypothetical protein